MGSTTDLFWKTLENDYYKTREIQLKEIEYATGNFADRNLIAQGSSVKIYRGQLLLESNQLINIVARKYEQKDRDSVIQEMRMYQSFSHDNIVSVFKYSLAGGGKIIVINKHEANGSLDQHLKGSTLNWIQRLRICIGVARALSYIHNRDIIHGNIKSSKILLDHNWESKLQGFGYSAEVNKLQRYVPSKYNGIFEYMDPEYEKTRGLTHKSDMFSFGVVLFEVLLGMKAFNPQDNSFFTRLARLHYEKRTLNAMIDPDLWNQMNPQSFKIFSDLAYCCLKEKREERPHIHQIVEALEKALENQLKHENQIVEALEKALEHQVKHESQIVEALEKALEPQLKHENQIVGDLEKAVEGEGSSSNNVKGKSFEHLKIPLSDILLATKNFSETYVIGSGGYGTVYKAELEYFDSKNYLVVDGENKCDLPKKCSTVAIKRIKKRDDSEGEQGFMTEIETLAICKHENIVSLLGFCVEGPHMILVCEHVSNGSLDDYLSSSYKITDLTWGRRIQICLDIAHGLMYLHSGSEEKQKIIHRDIKSANILLDDNWKAKIADFGLSKLQPKGHEGSTINTINVAGTLVYLDPEYEKTGKLKRASDIYSFGVVLFELLCGKLAYDKTFYVGDEKGLSSVARRLFKEGKIMAIVDPKIEGADVNIFMPNREANQKSFDTFSKIANQCLAETQAARPKIEKVIEKLKQAFQDINEDNLLISLEEIMLATQNFSDKNCIGNGMYWKQYKGVIRNAGEYTTVVVKRWNIKSDKGKFPYFTELKVLYEQKHKTIVGLVGYCNEMDERIIVYKYAYNEALSKHLNNASLTWTKRLKICLDVATGLDFLHRDDAHKEAMIHRDIKSSSILLDYDWKAKICNLEQSTRAWEEKEIEHVTDDNAYGSLGYVDPKYEQGFLTKKSDIYSLGVVLFEILCGRFAWGVDCADKAHSLGPIAIRHYEDGNIGELVFEGIKEQIDLQSRITFADIAFRCLDNDDYERPTASEVAIHLEKALELQEDKEIWEPKLPREYKDILSMSKFTESGKIYTKKDIYDILRKGVPLRDNNVNLSIGSNGEKNYMISARKFYYKNCWALNWLHIPQSRFHKVAKMLNVLDLNIRIKMRTQFLSPDVNYGVHLVFSFCSPRKASKKPMYVNLMYKMGNKTFHSYFATWRDKEWMMIELYRFLNHKDDNNNFEIILERFSRPYCGKGAIYIEGIEFRVINHVIKHETENLHQKSRSYSYDILRRPSNLGGRMYMQKKVKGKMHYVFSAEEVCQDVSDVKSFRLKPSTESRFQVVIELLRQQVFDMKCHIKPYMLTEFTLYDCYLVFKLSKNCHGLHCPVTVRDCRLPKKETKIVYLRSPNQWNLHDTNQVPEEREDGWMEVIVCTFKSYWDTIPLHLKLKTYEGTMSGLIVYGLEFRPCI